jgi:hypothetical protein
MHQIHAIKRDIPSVGGRALDSDSDADDRKAIVARHASREIDRLKPGVGAGVVP